MIFDISGTPEFCEDGKTPLSVTERLYIKNKDVITAYEEILIPVALYMRYYFLEGYDIIDNFHVEDLPIEVLENIRTLYNNTPYKETMSNCYFVDLNKPNQDYDYWRSLEGIIISELTEYGTEIAGTNIKSESGEVLRALTVLALIWLDSLGYEPKYEHSKYGRDIISLNPNHLEKIKNIELPKVELESVDILDEVEEITYYVFDNIIEDQETIESLVDIVAERFSKETGGVIDKKYFIEEVHFPSQTLKIFNDLLFKDLCLCEYHEKFNITAPLDEYLRKVLEIIEGLD